METGYHGRGLCYELSVEQDDDDTGIGMEVEVELTGGVRS